MALCLLDVKGNGSTLMVRKTIGVQMGLTAEVGCVFSRVQAPGCPRYDRFKAVAVTVFRAQVFSEHLLT